MTLLIAHSTLLDPMGHSLLQQRGLELMAGVSRQGTGVNEVIKV